MLAVHGVLQTDEEAATPAKTPPGAAPITAPFAVFLLMIDFGGNNVPGANSPTATLTDEMLSLDLRTSSARPVVAQLDNVSEHISSKQMYCLGVLGIISVNDLALMLHI